MLDYRPSNPQPIFSAGPYHSPAGLLEDNYMYEIGDYMLMASMKSEGFITSDICPIRKFT